MHEFEKASVHVSGVFLIHRQKTSTGSRNTSRELTEAWTDGLRNSTSAARRPNGQTEFIAAWHAWRRLHMQNHKRRQRADIGAGLNTLLTLESLYSATVCHTCVAGAQCTCDCSATSGTTGHCAKTGAPLGDCKTCCIGSTGASTRRKEGSRVRAQGSPHIGRERADNGLERADNDGSRDGFGLRTLRNSCMIWAASERPADEGQADNPGVLLVAPLQETEELPPWDMPGELGGRVLQNASRRLSRFEAWQVKPLLSWIS